MFNFDVLLCFQIDQEDKEAIFGKDFNFGSAFLEMDKDHNGKVSTFF